MKGSQNLHQLQQHKKEKDDALWVIPKGCLICNKIMPGAYGHTTIDEVVHWSCSAVCEKKVQQRKKETSKCNVVHVNRALCSLGS